jgi:fumarate hydratase class I
MDLKHITSPLRPDVIKSLCAGDRVSISGRIVTGRDQVHKYLAAGGEPPINLEGLVIYHCGPIVIQENSLWKIVAAGPTTSMREEPFEADIISHFKPGAIMGKGGMGEKTLKALCAYGCVYLHATGGAAQYLAERIVQVEGVYLTEFGLVTMDSHGRSLHGSIEDESSKRLKTLYEHPFNERSSHLT